MGRSGLTMFCVGVLYRTMQFVEFCEQATRARGRWERDYLKYIKTLSLRRARGSDVVHSYRFPIEQNILIRESAWSDGLVTQADTFARFCTCNARVRGYGGPCDC